MRYCQLDEKKMKALLVPSASDPGNLIKIPVFFPTRSLIFYSKNDNLDTNWGLRTSGFAKITSPVVNVYANYMLKIGELVYVLL